MRWLARAVAAAALLAGTACATHAARLQPTDIAIWPAPPPGSDHKAEAAIVLANVLTAVGVQGFRTVPNEQLAPALRRHDVVWLAEGGLVGLMNIETSSSFSNADQVAASLLAADSETCKGAFVGGRDRTVPATGSTRLLTACRSVEKPTEVDYTIVPRKRGGFYVFAVVGPPERAAMAQDWGARFHEAALRSLSGH